jgi:iron-regulated transporter 1
MDKKWEATFVRYHRASEPSPTVNFTFVVLLVMTGLTIVLAIPYFLLRKKGAKGGSGGSLSTSFAQMLTQSKKKQSGHIN